MLTEDKVISVVVPHLDNHDQLARCVSALDAQSLDRESYEVIIVDNGSAVPIAQSVVDLVDRVIYYKVAKTPYGCRNAGIKMSHGDIVALIDSTCLAERQWLERGIDTMGQECSIVAGRFDIVYSELDRYSQFYALSHLCNRASVKHSVGVVGGNLFVRRDVFDTVGYFPESIRSGGDIRWSSDCLARGIRICYADDAVCMIEAKDKKSLLAAEQRFGRGAYLQNRDKGLAFHLKMILYHLLPDKPSRITDRISYQDDPAPFEQRFWALWWVTWHTNLLFLKGYLSAMLSRGQ